MKSISILLISLLSLNYSCKKEETKVEPTPVVIDNPFTKTVEFESTDGLIITADHYHIDKTKPIIVLCHQAGSSRGEYKEIAVTLNSLGFNCLAIDQRSGNAVNGVTNETNAKAVTAGKATGYNDSKQDVVSAVNWAKTYYNKNVILWGSSYSSSLALIVAAEEINVEKVLAFSPGEYLSPTVVSTSISSLNKPAFLTSAKNEKTQTSLLFNVISSTNKTQFTPTGAGNHGSQALWTSRTDHAEYWVAVKTFLGV